MTQQCWHQLSADEALAAQQTASRGLGTEEAARRLAYTPAPEKSAENPR